jgi:hypothetical protein
MEQPMPSLRFSAIETLELQEQAHRSTCKKGGTNSQGSKKTSSWWQETLKTCVYYEKA